jgi:uncharacterized protein (TIGR03000 family)
MLSAALLLVHLLLAPASAGAQIVLDGGRVVIGSPPPWDFYKHYAGHGNYPGGYGFTPGYGYYPYYSGGPDWPPLLRHHRGQPADGPVLPDASAPAEVLPPGCAVLDLRVPPDAEVWFSGSPTAQLGGVRRFVTPPLEPGRQLYYDVRVRWTVAGRPVERAEAVRVYPGDRRTLDFLAVPSQPSLP